MFAVSVHTTEQRHQHCQVAHNVISIVKLHIKPYLADIFSIIDITWGSCLETPEQSENLQVNHLKEFITCIM